ncbi:MAG: TIGR03960 family B12-binding radical SAM protein [Planctomycetota bacterium]
MDDLLARVERPSRYLGNELNAVKKDLSQVSFKVGLAYPDRYEIGMSNTGLHILYYMLNEAPDLAAERVYLPARDLEALLREEGRPLTTLENRIPLHELDLLGVQLPHELAYANVVKTLRMGGITLWTKDRGDREPLILGGGPGAFGPEPVAPFYDAILLGDAEEALWEIVAVTRKARADGAPRAVLHRRLAAITGVYVPSLYEPRYGEDGLLLETAPIDPVAPALVHKAVIEDLETAYYPDKAIVPYAETVHNRLGIEVMRGCTVGCRFCQAGMIYRPLRERSPRRILDLAKCGLQSTGYEDVSLLSLDTGDYTLIDPLTKALLEETADKRVALSLPSLRAGSLTDDVIRDIRRVRRTSFTIAPEAGTQRLRDVINKNISDEEIFETVDRVAQNGWSEIKLYFMVGFPTETDDDLDGLVELVTRCREIGRRYKKKFNCTASIGTLVPKPQTPFQWDEQLPWHESLRRMRYVTERLRARGIGAKYHDADNAWLEGVFSRGDRRLAAVIADAEARGAGFESWQEELNLPLWKQVLADHDVDPERYLRRRGYEETLPWDHLSARVTKKYLLGDRKKVDRMASPTTFDCRDDLCAGCAVCFDDDIRNRLAKYHPDPFGDGRRLPLALTDRIAMGHGVARQLEEEARGRVRDQAAKAGEDAIAAKLRRRRPKQPGERRWAVTPGAPGAPGPAQAFDLARLEREDELRAEAERLEAERVEAERLAREALEAAAEPERLDPRGLPILPAKVTFQYRARHVRRGDLRWLGHLELARAVYRAMTRSTLPLTYTKGFHPKPKLGFGPPLPTGAESLDEELDLWLDVELSSEEVLAELKRVLPRELAPSQVERRFDKRTAAAERTGGRWSVGLRSLDVDEAAAEAALVAYAAREELVLEVPRPGKRPRRVDLKQVLRDPRVEGGCLDFDLLVPDEGSAKPYVVVAALLGLDEALARRGRYMHVAALRGPRLRPAGAEGSGDESGGDGPEEGAEPVVAGESAEA